MKLFTVAASLSLGLAALLATGTPASAQDEGGVSATTIVTVLPKRGEAVVSVPECSL
jgi:hypothetical protein